jgi:hypothetical protein
MSKKANGNSSVKRIAEVAKAGPRRVRRVNPPERKYGNVYAALYTEGVEGEAEVIQYATRKGAADRVNTHKQFHHGTDASRVLRDYRKV